MATAIVATAFGGPEVLSVVEQPVPKPLPGEVTIRVRAAGVNPIDYLLYSGALGDDQDSLPLQSSWRRVTPVARSCFCHDRPLLSQCRAAVPGVQHCARGLPQCEHHC
ncbi:MAG: hypothetical protein ACRDST_13100 [Pseudonocardiaceae bacterium]